ncbi:MAG: alkaline shock response membrane anchor protein AmaP [Chloroflexi bacterium]|nr:alkaline shock response membrane anchor protein AmaP [Chloroflexota bacterium]
MNLFNRIFTFVALVVLAIVGTATLITPDQVLLFITNTANTIHGGLLGSVTDAARIAIRIVIALIYIAVILALVWLEIRRPSSRHVEVAKTSGGQIRIHTADVEARIQQQVDAVGGIISARVHVDEKDRAVIAKLDVLAAPGADLVAKGEEVAAVTRIAVQDQLGLKLKDRPLVTIKSGKLKPVAETRARPSAADKTSVLPPNNKA